MITGKDIYEVFAALVPLYVAMAVAYASVRWWKIFNPDQCAGINRFVAVFAVPLLSFNFIASNNPYTMNFQFIAADSLQKVVILVALFLWNTFTKHGSVEWAITFFSLSTLPNTLVMGIPLLKAMYGDFSGALMVQIVVLQSVVWYTLLLFMFEFRAAKLLIAEQFPESAASMITSFKVDPDVISLSSRDQLLQADAEIDADGKLHVTVRRSSASSIVSSFNKSHLVTTPRESNLTGADIYSLHSSRQPTPRASNCNQNDLLPIFSNKSAGDVLGVYPVQSLMPRTSNFDKETLKMANRRGGRSTVNEEHRINGDWLCPYPSPNPMFSGSTSSAARKDDTVSMLGNKDLHMFMWSSNTSPISEGSLRHAVLERPASTDCPSMASLHENSTINSMNHDMTEKTSFEMKANGRKDLDMEVPMKSANATKETVESENADAYKKQSMPPATVITKLIFLMVWRKLVRNPNTYASLLGLAWSLISFRYNIEMPKIIQGSISILSNGGLGIAMFSLGLFMALQPKLITCGKAVAAFAMAVRFLAGPAVIAATSGAVGLRGVLLQVSIVQAALPQGIVPFVFAKEYDMHADILSTAVIFGMLVAVPVTIAYYMLLGL